MSVPVAGVCDTVARAILVLIQRVSFRLEGPRWQTRERERARSAMIDGQGMGMTEGKEEEERIRGREAMGVRKR